jgi:single-strand DNA-binding protein
MNQITNNVQLLGNLGRNPEIKKFDSGKKKANLLLACNEFFTDESGKRNEKTQWFNVVAWEGLATLAEQHMHKGKQIAVSGRLNNRTWTDDKGLKHYVTEIVCNDIMLLGGAKKEDAQG